MPDRIIRDELLTSPRYWAVSIEAQRLYVHLLLVADDTARFSGNNYTIRLACYPGHQVQTEKVESLLSELVDKDLVRLYAANDDRFVFIPRYKQRLRYKHSRYPAPPKEISDLAPEKTDLSPSKDGPKTDSGQTQDRLKTAEVKRSEVNQEDSKEAAGAAPVEFCKDVVFRVGVPMLISRGVEEGRARSVLGKYYARESDRERLLQVMFSMSTQPYQIEPIAYLTKAMQPKQRRVSL